MKTKIFIISLLVFYAYTTNGQIKITSGNVTSIGNMNSPSKYLIVDYTGYYGVDLAIYPSYDGYAFLGKSNRQFMYIYSTHNVVVSDSRAKENIRNINHALNLVKKMQGIKFDYKLNYFVNDTSKISLNKKNAIRKSLKDNLGFIAQDVQKVLPEIVSYDDSTDIYGIDYAKITPVLVEAIKELSGKVDSLETIITKSSGTLKSARATDGTGNLDIEKAASLNQNSPNPFNQNTTIAYYLPETVVKAAIYIYNMQGTQVKVILVSSTGNGNVIIYGSELQPGMYFYSLIADGKEIDTKKMILTE